MNSYDTNVALVLGAFTISVAFYLSSSASAADCVYEGGAYSVGAVVSRGGRPDLAGPALARVQAPTLLIVGGEDIPVIALNQEAYDQLRIERALQIIPGAAHLFEEPGALEQVADLATEWLARYLAPSEWSAAAEGPRLDPWM